MLFGIIYKSTILIPESSFYNKIYIGQKKCKSITDFYNSGYKGSGIMIFKIKEKYGKNKFKQIKTEIIYCMFDNDIQTSKEKLLQLGEWEKHFIKLYNSTNLEIGINKTAGGLSGDTFSFQSEEKQKEIRQKISKKHVGLIHSSNTKKKMSISSKGKTKSEVHKLHMRHPKSDLHKIHMKGRLCKIETRKKIRLALKGKPKSIEHCKNISKSRVGLKQSRVQKAKHSQNMKKVWSNSEYKNKMKKILKSIPKSTQGKINMKNAWIKRREKYGKNGRSTKNRKEK